MTFLEFLDRVGERRAQREPRPTRDIRQFIGFMFLAGYYLMVYNFIGAKIPQENLPLIRDAMLTLGPPVGLIVGAMFRNDKTDETRAANTGKFADAIKATAQAAPGSKPDKTLKPGETAQAVEEPPPE